MLPQVRLTFCVFHRLSQNLLHPPRTKISRLANRQARQARKTKATNNKCISNKVSEVRSRENKVISRCNANKRRRAERTELGPPRQCVPRLGVRSRTRRWYMRETRDRAQYAQPASPVLFPVTSEGNACTLYAITKEMLRNPSKAKR